MKSHWWIVFVKVGTGNEMVAVDSGLPPAGTSSQAFLSSTALYQFSVSPSLRLSVQPPDEKSNRFSALRPTTEKEHPLLSSQRDHSHATARPETPSLHSTDGGAALGTTLDLRASVGLAGGSLLRDWRPSSRVCACEARGVAVHLRDLQDAVPKCWNPPTTHLGC
jgi:hypothetical protein